MTSSIIYRTNSAADTSEQNDNERLRIAIHVQAEIISEKEAIKKASSWLLMNVGNLLRADNPELILGEPLMWRLDVWLSTPALSPPRENISGRIGQICVDASTGEVFITDSLINELKAAADALVAS